jgi:hypothetical protein
MTSVLLRSGKDPFTRVDAESTLQQRLLNSNIGNQLFQLSVQRALSTPGTEIVSNGTLSETRAASARDIDRAGERFDAFVVPLANAFRPDFMRRLTNLTSFISRLRIPVVVVGVGIQADVDGDLEPLRSIAEPVREFVSAVLERSASIGVRGPVTAAYLRGLGFPDDAVDVIGCPSLFMQGPDFRLSAAPPWPGSEARVALNVTPGVPGLGPLCRDWVEHHANLELVGQEKQDLALLLWGEEQWPRLDPWVPTHLDHPLYQQGRVVFPLDGRTWIDHLRGFDLAVGTRFHGNVAALLADTPAVALVHDARTRELTELHRMPHRPMRALDRPKLEELYGGYDPTGFNAAYPVTFRRFTRFLERNGLEHVYAPGGSATEFDQRLAGAELAPLVRPLPPDLPAPVRERLRWLHRAVTAEPLRHPDGYRHPYPHPAPPDRVSVERLRRRDAERELATMSRALDRQNQVLRRQAARLRRLEGEVAELRKISRIRRGLRRLRVRVGGR